MSKLIHELPWKVRFNLSLLLDQLDPPNHTWKSLIGELDNLNISSIEVNAVERQGQIPGKSPTEVLLNTLEHKNYTVDDIYRGLHKIEHRRAMDIISKYGAHARYLKLVHNYFAHSVSPGAKKEIEELDAKQTQNDVLPEGIELMMLATTSIICSHCKQISLYNFQSPTRYPHHLPVVPAWRPYRLMYSHSHFRIWSRLLKISVHSISLATEGLA